ncbi:MAG: hypothetical protein M3133_07510, partial [Actinomycetota bacterium]|nr:hypothetical protein [Actinomycetota bacterium]
MDEALFERGPWQPEEPPSDLDASVERLFSDAVERQVAEQRTLNRLVEAATDRLAGLETDLRGLRDSTSTQVVALRLELQEGVTRLADDVQARFRELAEDMDRLRATSTDHAARLVQMTQTVTETLADVDERLRGGGEGGAQPDPAGSIEARIGPYLLAIRQQLDERFAELGDRLGQVQQRVAALEHQPALPSLQAAMNAALEQLRAGVAHDVHALREHLDDEVQRLIRVTAGPLAGEDGSEPPLETIRTALAALQDRTESIAAGLVDELLAVRDERRASTHQLTQWFQALREEQERSARELLALLQSELGQLRDGEGERLSARLGDELAALRDEGNAALERVAAQLGAELVTLRTDREETAEQIAARLRETLDPVRAEQAVAAGRLLETVEWLRDELQDLRSDRELVGREVIARLREELGAAVDPLREATTTALQELLHEAEGRAEAAEERL